MIKKIFIIIIFEFLTIFAQDAQKQNPGVQLPDFVITGKDIISVENAKKIPPPFIPTVSEEFFKPTFSPEELKINEVDIPIKGSQIPYDSVHFYNGKIDAGMGLYSLPYFDLNYSQQFADGIIEGFAKGLNQKAFISNSDKYSISGGANLLLFVSDKSSILPGTHFKFSGNYSLNNYKLYNSYDPLTRRNLSEGYGSLKIDNLISKYIIFSGNIEDNLTAINAEKYTENLMKIEGFAKMGFPAFYLGMDAGFQKQFLTIDSLNNYKSFYFTAKPYAELNITDLLKASFGLDYAQVSGDNFFSIYASGALNLGNGLSLYGDFSPGTEYLTSKHFLNINPYYSPQHFVDLFVKKNAAINAYLKYEYQRYFEIDAGIKYFNVRNLPYFSDVVSKGVFNIYTAKAKSYSAFVNFLMPLGIYGQFYGTIEANSTKEDSLGKFVPYFPQFMASINYGYNFQDGLCGQIKLKYDDGNYTNITNSTKLNPYFNIGFDFSYQVSKGFLLNLNLSNLVNNKNFIWNGYQDLPLNVSLGLSYNF